MFIVPLFLQIYNILSYIFILSPHPDFSRFSVQWVEFDKIQLLSFYLGASVIGRERSILAACIANTPIPPAKITWHVGALEKNTVRSVNVSVHAGKASIVTSYLIGVSDDSVNGKEVQCVINHPTQDKAMIINYTIDLNCK